jgi:hypothetical protein
MDNHSFPDDAHVFAAQHSDNDINAEDMSELVSLDARGLQPQQQTTTDVEISGEGSNTLPLASFSDSSYQDHDSPDSESSRDAHEVEMQTINDRSLSDHAVPNPSPTSHTALDHPAVNNRRARVEDDEDEDRDRRHPSQRIGNSANAASSAGPSSSTPLSFPQLPTPPPQATLGARFRGQAPIFTRTVVDEAATGSRNHPFRFFQHLMSNNNNSNDNNDTGNINPVPSSGAPAPAQPHQDGHTPDNQPHGRIETFSVTVDIGLVGPAFSTGGGGAHPHEGQAFANPADPNFNANPNDAQNPNIQGINIADFMARLSQAIGGGDNGTEGTATAPTDDNPAQGPGAAGATPGAPFGLNIPGGFNLANLAGLGFGFNFDGSGFGEKEDPERARKLVDGLEEVPVGLVRRLERIGGTGGGMGEDETKGGDGGCAICWDRLLGNVEESVHQHQECEKKEEESEGSQPETSMNTNEASNRTTKIVSLPCAHVFHAECLIPWFSRPRQTTCPTCRFNIDPENLTYVSWRRRMRERRERERAEARARDPDNADGDEADQEGVDPPTAAAEPAVAPDIALVPEEVLSFLSRPFVPVRAQTPDVSVPIVRPTPAPRSSSQPPASSSSSSLLSDPAPSTSQPASQTHVGGGEDHWDTMPGLEDASNSEDEEDNEDDDEDEDEDEDVEDEDGAHEEGNGIQTPPVLPHLNEPPTTTPGAQAQAPRPRQNDPFAPRTIQTPHGLITFIPVPFNFPFPATGNGVGVGVQAGGNGDYSHSFLELPFVNPASVAATANPQVPPAFGQGQGQGQFPNGNANANAQGE